MKISIEELNIAYEKVNSIYKINGKITKERVEIAVERNPLIDENYFDLDSKYITPFKLIFIADKNLKRYILETNVEVIEDDLDED